MILKKRTEAAVLLLLFAYALQGQVTFSKRIDVAFKKDASIHFLLDNDTFLISTRVTESYNPYWTFSYCMMPVKSDGTIITQKRFKRNNQSFFNAGNIIKINNTYYTADCSTYGYDNQSVLIALNSSADTLFTKCYGDTTFYNMSFYAMRSMTNPKNILLFGMTDSTCGSAHSGTYKPVIATVDTLGNSVSKKIYLNTCKYRASISSTDTTKVKGYIFSGFESTSPPYGTNFVAKVDSNLNTVWAQNYDTANSVTASIITLKSGKHVMAYGRLDSSQQNAIFWSRIAILKMDENGTVLWKKQYGNLTHNATATCIRELANGDFIVCGVTDVHINNQPSFTQLYGFLMRTDSSGNEKWFQTYNVAPAWDTIGQNYLYEVMPMSDGGFAAVGFLATIDTAGAGQDTWLLRVDSNGCLMPGCSVTAVENHTMEFLTLQLYPNPCYDNLNIGIDLPASIKEARMLLIDVTGNILESKTIYNHERQKVFNTSALSEGVYFVSLQAAGLPVKWSKFVKLK